MTSGNAYGGNGRQPLQVAWTRRALLSSVSRGVCLLFGAIVLLQSMTGFGEAHCQQDGLAVAVEIRTINSRYFKLTVRSSEGYASLEPQVEAAGARADPSRHDPGERPRRSAAIAAKTIEINVDVLDRYRRQLESLQRQVGVAAGRCRSRPCLPLPGVVDDASGAAVDATADWPVDRAHLADRARQPRPHARRGGPGHGRRPGRQLPHGRRPVSIRSSAARRWWSKSYRNRLYERLKRRWPN